MEESEKPREVEHSQNKLVVKSQEQREEEVGTEPCELDGTGDRVLVLEVVGLGRLCSTSIALDIKLALHITLSLLGGEEGHRLLVIGTRRHYNRCAGLRGDALVGGLSCGKELKTLSLGLKHNPKPSQRRRNRLF
jgi:hypothetical protein